MPYEETQATLISYSDERDQIDQYSRKIRESLERTGSQFDGPITLARVTSGDLSGFLQHLKDKDTAPAENFPDWLFEIARSQEHIDTLTEFANSRSEVFGRKYRIYDEQAINTIFSMESPGAVTVIAEVGVLEHSKGQGHDPYSYDPNVDYVTE